MFDSSIKKKGHWRGDLLNSPLTPSCSITVLQRLFAVHGVSIIRLSAVISTVSTDVYEHNILALLIVLKGHHREGEEKMKILFRFVFLCRSSIRIHRRRYIIPHNIVDDFFWYLLNFVFPYRLCPILYDNNTGAVSLLRRTLPLFFSAMENRSFVWKC